MTDSGKKFIQIKNLHKYFGDNEVLKGINLEVNRGEVVAIIGPSGCGKSTFLRSLNLLETPTRGEILFDNIDITDPKLDINITRQKIGMVFQKFNLFPNYTVLENIILAPVQLGLMKKDEAVENAMRLLERVGLPEKADSYPASLSGGQQQRVAIARALIKQPQLLLLDEPLSNLDARLRIEMREEIRRIQLETGVTSVFVTHDQEEAMSISDSIILMKLGVKQQEAKPQELYDEPFNEFVSDFLGTPPINKVFGTIEDGAVRIDSGPLCKISGLEKIHNGHKVHFSIRAESFLVNVGTPLMEAEVIRVFIMGKEKLAYLKLGDFEVRAYVDSDQDLKTGDIVKVGLRNKGVFVFDAETGERLR